MPKILGSYEGLHQLLPFYDRFTIYFISLNFDKSSPILLEDSTCRGYFPDIALIPSQPEKREKESFLCRVVSFALILRNRMIKYISLTFTSGVPTVQMTCWSCVAVGKSNLKVWGEVKHSICSVKALCKKSTCSYKARADFAFFYFQSENNATTFIKDFEQSKEDGWSISHLVTPHLTSFCSLLARVWEMIHVIERIFHSLVHGNQR